MSTHTQLSESLTECSVSYPVVTHDRKGREGKGREIGGEDALSHASYLTERAVDNSAAATADRTSAVACKSIDRRWS